MWFLPDITAAFYYSILSEIERYSHHKNYDVIFGQSFEKPERERKIRDNRKSLRADDYSTPVFQFRISAVT